MDVSNIFTLKKVEQLADFLPIKVLDGLRDKSGLILTSSVACSFLAESGICMCVMDFPVGEL